MKRLVVSWLAGGLAFAGGLAVAQNLEISGGAPVLIGAAGTGGGGGTVTTAPPITGDGTPGNPIGCQDATTGQGGCVTDIDQGFTGIKTFDSGIVTNSTIDAKSNIINSSAGNGGSVAFSDPIRNLSTTTALFESSTTATGGTDTAFKFTPLNVLSATDQVFLVQNAVAGTLAYIQYDGSATFNNTITSGVASGSNALTLGNGQRLVLGGGASAFLSGDGVSVNFDGIWRFGSGGGAGIIDVRGTSGLNNQGSNNGGSIPLNDAARWLSTTTALLESSTTATGGTDKAFTLTPLNALASTDIVLAVNDVSATVAHVTYGGQGSFNGGVTIGASQSYTGAGAVTVSSGGSSALTLDSASGTVQIASGDTVNVAAGQGYTGSGSLTVASGGSSALTLDSASGIVQIASGDDVRVAAGQSYSGAGAVTLSSGGSSALTLDSASGTITASDSVEVAGGVTVGTALSNEVRLAGNVSLANPIIDALGSDTDIGINLVPKGTGNITVTANSLKANGGITIGSSGNSIAESFSGTATHDFASTATGSESTTTITVTGAADGDVCVVGVVAAARVTGSDFDCYVSSSNTVTLVLQCPGAATCDPGSQTYRVTVFSY